MKYVSNMMTALTPQAGLLHASISLWILGALYFLIFRTVRNLAQKIMELGSQPEFKLLHKDNLPLGAKKFFSNKTSELEDLGFQPLMTLIDHHAQKIGLFLYESVHCSEDGRTLVFLSYRTSAYWWLECLHLLLALRTSIHFRTQFSDDSDLSVKMGGFIGKLSAQDSEAHKLSRSVSLAEAFQFHQEEIRRIAEERHADAILVSESGQAIHLLADLTRLRACSLQSLWNQS